MYVNICMYIISNLFVKMKNKIENICEYFGRMCS